MKTRKEVDELKAQWADDGVWDLANTEGYEEYRDELAAFVKEVKQKWEAERRASLMALAASLGAPGNLALAEKWESLDLRLAKLEVAERRPKIARR